MSDYTFTQSQLGYLQSMSRKTCFIGGIGSGKTYTSSFIAINRAMENRVVLFVMPTFSMIRDVLIPTLKEHLDKMGLIERIDYNLTISQTPSLLFSNGGTILLKSAEMGERLRGINADDLFMDEISYIQHNVYKICIGRVRRSSDAFIRLSSTPSGEESWLYEEIQKGDWELFRQTTLSNPFIPKEYKIDLINTYGKDSAFFRQEILGEFISQTEFDQLLDINFIEDSRNRVKENGLRIASLDVARFGNDFSAFSLINGNHIEHLDKINGLSGPHLLDWLKSKYVEFGFDKIVIDCAGLGGEFFDFAKEEMKQCHFIEFNGAKTAKDSKSFANCRAESWFHIADFMTNWGSLDGVSSDYVIEFKKQLKSIRKFYNDKGQMQILSKKQIKTKGISSPDISDSLAMACWYSKTQTIVNDVANKLYGNSSIF